MEADLALVDHVAQLALGGLDDDFAVLLADRDDLAAEACGELRAGGGEQDVARLQAGELARLAGEGEGAVGLDLGAGSASRPR